MNNKKNNSSHFILTKITLLILISILLVTLFACKTTQSDYNNSSESASEMSSINTTKNISESEISISQQTSSKNETNSVTQQTPSTDVLSLESRENTLSISNIDDFEKLGLGKDDPRYSLIKAFLEGNTSELEKICYVEAGVFDAYKTLKIGKYSISYVKDYNVEFTFKLIESGLDTLPVGQYTFDVDLGMDLCFRNLIHKSSNVTLMPKQFNIWFGTCFLYTFPNINTLDATQKVEYFTEISDYLLCAYGDLTLEQMQNYALKLFNIKDFQPTGSIAILNNGVYTIGGHGGEIWAFDCTNITEKNGITTITLQFYADAAYTIKSHTIEYNIQNIDNDWAFLSSNYIYKSPFRPYHISQ